MTGWNGLSQTFSEWCLYHRGVFSFIRSVCAVIGTTALIIILFREFLWT